MIYAWVCDGDEWYYADKTGKIVGEVWRTGLTGARASARVNGIGLGAYLDETSAKEAVQAYIANPISVTTAIQPAPRS